MPYKNKVLQREAVKKAVQKHRVLQQGITEDVTPKESLALQDSVTPVTHPVLNWLVDPGKRKKLEAVFRSLKDRNQLENVRFGAGDYSLPMDIVGEMLEATD